MVVRSSGLEFVTCPRCASSFHLPPPGVGRGRFIGLKLLIWTVVLLAVAGDQEFGVIIGVLSVPFSAWLAALRLQNLGSSMWWTPLTLNLIGVLFLAIQPPARRKTK